jgi:hypothetical protein
MKLNIKRILIVVVAMILVGLLAVLIGRYTGQAMAEKSKERLAVLWPDVLALPRKDRAFLAQLSLDCNLPKEPIEANAVTNCLRQAATRMEEKDASTRAVQNLEALLPTAK